MKKIVVNNLNDLDIVLRVTRAMFEAQGPLDVVVKKFERNISKEQQGLYFKWMGIIGGELGYTKQEAHELYKEQFLLNIFVADPLNHQKFCGMIDDLNALKVDAPGRRNSIRDYIISTVSIMDATVKNMSDYMREIEAVARDLNIALPMPDQHGLLI